MKSLLILAAASLGGLSSSPTPPGIPAPPLTLSREGMQLILDHEVGGGAIYYNRRLSRPTWPGGASGVTIGVGYDLGYNTRAQIARDWSTLPPGTLSRLQGCAGVKGAAARLKLPAVNDITIPWDTAFAVYQRSTIPRFATATRDAYPGIQTLHPHIQSALLSWVFNRGPAIHPSSSRDREKRTIRIAIPRQPAALPAQFRASKRLWASSSLTGLLRRREAEAKLIEAGLAK